MTQVNVNISRHISCRTNYRSLSPVLARNQSPKQQQNNSFSLTKELENNQVDSQSTPVTSHGLNRCFVNKSFKMNSHTNKIHLQSSPYYRNVTTITDKSSSSLCRFTYSSEDDNEDDFFNDNKENINMKRECLADLSQTSTVSDYSCNLSSKTNLPTTPISSLSGGGASGISTSDSNINTNYSSSETTSTSPFKNFLKPKLVNEMQAPPPTSSDDNNYLSTSTSPLNVSDCDNSSIERNAIYSPNNSSYTSLSSFNADMKSTHSSIPSEYTTKSQSCKSGYYTDLPNSPGEIEPINVDYGVSDYFLPIDYYKNENNQQTKSSNYPQQQQQQNQKQYQFNNHSTIPHLYHPVCLNEVSSLTIDSNASKSNDITVIERTMMAGASNNTTATLGRHHHRSYDIDTSNISKRQRLNFTSNGSSAYNSEGNSFVIPLDNTNLNEDQSKQQTNNLVDDTAAAAAFSDDEKVVSYEMEGSICSGSTANSKSNDMRSNVSSLSFPMEPQADLEFIRSLLNKRSIGSNNNELILDEFDDLTKNNQLDQSYSDIKSSTLKRVAPALRKWSIQPVNPTNKVPFTPPIKLPAPSGYKKGNESNCLTSPPKLSSQFTLPIVNRSLFNGNNFKYEEENYKPQCYDSDQGDTNSNDDILSIPSEIRIDSSVDRMTKSQFSAIKNKFKNGNFFFVKF
jgi:hypothetical protein